MLFWRSFLSSLTLFRVACYVSLSALLALLLGVYWQEFQGLTPCPMCIVQRYLMVLLVIAGGLLAYLKPSQYEFFAGVGMALLSLMGMIVAAWQSWMQWFPSGFESCSRNAWGAIERLSFQQWFPLLFKGDADCSVVLERWGGLSIANLSFLFFCAVTLALIVAIFNFKKTQ